MSLVPEFQKELLSKIFNDFLKGMGTVTVQRKYEISATAGPEKDYEWKNVYEDMDCMLQCLSSFATIGFRLIPTGVMDLTKSICFVPIRIRKNDGITEIVILTDDRLITGGETYKVLRANPYPSHQELICEPENG